MILFSNLNYGKFADIVDCCYCGEAEMAVPQGTETCPICGKNGCLTWSDKYYNEETNCSEIKVEEINSIHKKKTALYFD